MKDANERRPTEQVEDKALAEARAHERVTGHTTYLDVSEEASAGCLECGWTYDGTAAEPIR